MMDSQEDFLIQLQRLEKVISGLTEQLESVRKTPASEIQIGDVIVKSNGQSLDKCLDTALKISGLKRIQNDSRIKEAWHL